jgi:hypothetical protein
LKPSIAVILAASFFNELGDPNAAKDLRLSDSTRLK